MDTSKVLDAIEVDALAENVRSLQKESFSGTLTIKFNKGELAGVEREPSNGLNYKKAYSYEGFGGPTGSFGMKVLIATSREINDNDKRVLGRKIDEIQEAIMAETIKLDPKTIERREKDRAEIIALFPEPIFVEEIPNGYGPNDPWYSNFPWYQVTTKIGRIKIGWRKRVINIDWTETTNKLTGEELVPEGDMTKSGKYDNTRYIHAWGYEKAKQYIEKLLA